MKHVDPLMLLLGMIFGIILGFWIHNLASGIAIGVIAFLAYSLLRNGRKRSDK